MKDYQIINLAYEVADLMEMGMNLQEAMEEIQNVLETEYIKELESEIDEEILYGWNEVISDILDNIKTLYLDVTYKRVFN